MRTVCRACGEEIHHLDVSGSRTDTVDRHITGTVSIRPDTNGADYVHLDSDSYELEECCINDESEGEFRADLFTCPMCGHEGEDEDEVAESGADAATTTERLFEVVGHETETVYSRHESLFAAIRWAERDDKITFIRDSDGEVVWAKPQSNTQPRPEAVSGEVLGNGLYRQKYRLGEVRTMLFDAGNGGDGEEHKYKIVGFRKVGHGDLFVPTGAGEKVWRSGGSYYGDRVIVEPAEALTMEAFTAPALSGVGEVDGVIDPLA